MLPRHRIPTLIALAALSAANAAQDGIYHTFNDDVLGPLTVNGNFTVAVRDVTAAFDLPSLTIDIGASIEGSVVLDIEASSAVPFTVPVPLASVPLPPIDLGLIIVTPLILPVMEISGTAEAGLHFGFEHEYDFDTSIVFAPTSSVSVVAQVPTFLASAPVATGATGLDLQVSLTATLAFLVNDSSSGFFLGAPFVDAGVALTLTVQTLDPWWEVDASFLVGAGYYFPGLGILLPSTLYDSGPIDVAHATGPLGTPSPDRWSRSYHIGITEGLTAMAPTSDGGLIALGNAAGAGNKGWIAKLNADGAIVWEKKARSLSEYRPETVHETADGGFLVGANRTVNSIARVNRLDAFGDKVWSYDYWELTGYGISLQSGVPTADGGYVFTGSNNHAFYTTPIVVRLDANGIVVWAKELSYLWSTGDLAYGTDVIETSDSSILVVGSILHDDGAPALAVAGRNAFVMKMDGPTGALQYIHAVGTLGYDYANCVTEGPPGQYVVGGRIDENIGIEAAWAFGFIDPGFVLWSRAYAGESIAGSPGDTPFDELTDIEAVDTGGYIATGASSVFSSECDAWLLKLGEGSGKLVWFKSYRGLAFDYLAGVHPLDDGYLAYGYTKSLVPLGTGGGEADMWAVRTSHDGFLNFKTPNGFDVHNDKAVAIKHQLPDIVIGSVTMEPGAFLIDVAINSADLALEHDPTSATVDLLTK